jgi:enolase-phosphatase E1
VASEAHVLQSTVGGEQGVLHIAADAVLVDIEGTISPASFVRDTLFPYSRERLADYVAANSGNPTVQDILARTSALADGADAVGTLIGWQEQDIKAPPLKKLQGLIWESGYRSGELKSPIFSDAFRALKLWKAEGLPLYVYSSGSVQAQLLFFEFNTEGDLRPLFSAYFDTEIGAKTEPSSYLSISESIRATPGGFVFFSDNAKELQAARLAGFQPIHVVKDDTEPHTDFPQITDYRQVALARRN